MRTSIFVPVLLVTLATAASPLTAQRPAADSAAVASVMVAGIRLLHPAQLVLDHRDELSLTADQVTRIEALVLAQRDSEAVRQRRFSDAITEQMISQAGHPSAVMSWTGSVDEEAIRAEARRTAEREAEFMINSTRDRHAVGAVLTPLQLALLPRIQMAELMRGMPAQLGPSSAPQGEDHPYFEFQVEKAVVTLPGRGPVYPPSLRAEKVEGEVLAQFVIDTTGRFEPGSFHVLKSSHALFTQALRDALPEMRFVPAEVGGRKVRQLVQQPFTFALDAK